MPLWYLQTLLPFDNILKTDSICILEFVKLFQIASILLRISPSISEVDDKESLSKVFKQPLIQSATMTDVIDIHSVLWKVANEAFAFSPKTRLESLITSDIFQNG